MFGGTALNKGSIEAVGGGVISGGVVGSSGAVFAGALTSGGQVSGYGTVINPNVASKGYAIVGGGAGDFVVKGFSVDGQGGVMSGGTFNPGSVYGIGNAGVGTGGTIFGSQAIFATGTSINQLFVGSDAVQTLYSSGVASQSTVLGGTVLNSGGTTSGATILSGGSLNVTGGTYTSWLHPQFKVQYGGYGTGTSSNDYIGSGATELVGQDGITSNSVLTSGAVGIVTQGGTSLFPVISGGTETVSAGGLLSSGSVSGQGSVFVSSAGAASSLNVSSTGFAQVLSGGTGYAFVANSGGTVVVDSGGSLGRSLLNSGGTLTVPSGAVIYSGATLNYANTSFALSSGATADYLVASNGTVLAVPGATIGSIYTVNSGVGSVASGISVNTLLAGFDPNNPLANGDGTVILDSGGTAATFGAQGGATALANSGTITSGVSISGGTGTLLKGVYVASGATMQVSGGTTNGSPYDGYLYVDTPNQFKELDIGSGASAFVDSGASVGSVNITNNGMGTVGSGVFASSLSVTGANASAFLSSGATVPNVVLASGATVEIPRGGAGVSVLSAISGATGIIDSGARLNSVSLSSANATIASGVFVSKLTVLSGASGVLMPGASVQHIEVANGGWISGATVANNGELVVSSGGTAIQSLIKYDSGMWATNPYTMVQSGGTVANATVAGAGSVGEGASNLGGLLTVESGAVLINTSMGYNARIKVNGLSYDSGGSVTVSNNILTVSENGQNWQMSISGNYDPSGFILNNDGAGNTVLIYQKCFLAGSMIRTPKGEKAVERLRKGETVCVYVDGKEETREITSVIQRRARVNSSQPEDIAGWSIIIAKDAFAQGVPNKDLSVTPEHCFYFEGRFVPVRMLVNGESIRYDHSQVEYDYYHIKTEPHSVLWANNTLTESWLDTEVQDIYKQDSSAEGIMRLITQQKLNWDEHAAAPLDTSQAFVEPLHSRFSSRAKKLTPVKQSFSNESLSSDMSADPAPYIRLDDGRTIQPQRHEAGRYLFSLPAHARKAILGSRTFRPSETVGPHLDDRRELGMLIGQVSLWTGEKEHIVTRHLTEKNLKGWDVIEAGPHRWTKGEAELLLHDVPASDIGQHMLSIEVQAGGPYKAA
ncbi:Hint domain-containing protein [Bombella sp. TMW 2.2559]|uniref:Hint domain-containing protein n=1 Tax=Bombella dulcis TaxID=2967339 RepID=A0ABT3WCE3_9PROT|nr:Hint domain-containing protein [Bombella dulcis]MCX5616767.1 Hint domain-containing protein [Bombella dulcis]